MMGTAINMPPNRREAFTNAIDQLPLFITD